MSVYQTASTNLLTTPFIKPVIFLNGEKVDDNDDSHLGAKKSSMFSVWIGLPSTYYLLYKEKEKRGVKEQQGGMLGRKVAGSHPSSSNIPVQTLHPQFGKAA